VEEDEEEMLRKALAMSARDIVDSDGDSVMTLQPAKTSYEEIVNLALEYGFDTEQAVQAISVVGTKNPSQVINYLMNVYGAELFQ